MMMVLNDLMVMMSMVMLCRWLGRWLRRIWLVMMMMLDDRMIMNMRMVMLSRWLRRWLRWIRFMMMMLNMMVMMRMITFGRLDRRWPRLRWMSMIVVVMGNHTRTVVVMMRLRWIWLLRWPWRSWRWLIRWMSMIVLYGFVDHNHCFIMGVRMRFRWGRRRHYRWWRLNDNDSVVPLNNGGVMLVSMASTFTTGVSFSSTSFLPTSMSVYHPIVFDPVPADRCDLHFCNLSSYPVTIRSIIALPQTISKLTFVRVILSRLCTFKVTLFRKVTYLGWLNRNRFF